MKILARLTILGIIGACNSTYDNPRVSKALNASKADTTKIKLSQYVNQAFPQWSAAHPDKACPDELGNLGEFMNSNDINDAWGRPLKMMCGANLPPGAKGLAVMSRGEDGKEGTEDDVKSWE